jgi:hypothetical protein
MIAFGKQNRRERQCLVRPAYRSLSRIRCDRFRGIAPAMDSRTNFCLDQSQPPLGSRFRALPKTVVAFVRVARIRMMLRRLAATAWSGIQTSRMGFEAPVTVPVIVCKP